MKLSKPAPGTVRVEIDIESLKGWEWWLLLRADAHHDNPHCRRDIELKHLKQAKERNAGIIDIGDLFCAMQGKFDRRGNKRDVHPETWRMVENGTPYRDALMLDAVNFYAPYADNWIMFSPGNHEWSIRDRMETDLTERLTARINERTGTSIQVGNLNGWVQFQFKRGGVKNMPFHLWYHHGYGGGGPVTKDMIQASRQAAYVEGADLMMTGHTHDAWSTDTVKIRLTSSGREERRTVTQLKIPTYKDEYSNVNGGYHHIKGRPPKPLGAYWVRFFAETDKALNDVKISHEVIRAR